MADAPREIWAYDDGAFIMAFDYETNTGGATRYVRANAIPLADAIAIPEIAALVEKGRMLIAARSAFDGGSTMQANLDRIAQASDDFSAALRKIEPKA